MYFGRVTTPPRQPPRPPPRPPTPPPRPPGARPPGPAKAAPSKAAASAKAAFAKAAGSPLFRRARNMLFRPRNEWNTISSEFTNASTIYKSYVIPLSAIGPIATMLGALVFGKVGTMFGPVNAPLGAALQGAVAHYVLGLASVYALAIARSEEHTSELQSPCNLVCRLLLEKKKKEHNHDNASKGTTDTHAA